MFNLFDKSILSYPIHYNIKINLKFVLIIFLYSSLTFTKLFFLLNNNYDIGMAWDWGIPNYNNVFYQLIDLLSPVNREFGNGNLIGYNFETYYWLILSIFALFFKKYYIFFLLVVLKSLNIVFFFKIIDKTKRNIFSLSLILVFSEMYFLQTRLIAGHLPFYFSMCLTPMLFYYLLNLQNKTRNQYILVLLSAFFCTNPTFIIIYYISILTFFLFHIKKIGLIIFIKIIFLSILVHINLYFFLLFSAIYPSEFLNTHVFDNLSLLFEKRYEEQTVKKSLVWFTLPVLNFAKSMFYELVNTRPIFLKTLNSALMTTLIISTVFIIKNKLLNIYSSKFILLLFISILLSTGVYNVILPILIYFNFEKLKPLLLFYSNPLRFLYLIFISIILIIAHDIENYFFKKTIIFFSLIVIILNLVFDNLNNYIDNNSYKENPQNLKINFLKQKPISEDFLNNILSDEEDDFYFIILPSPRNGWHLKPKSSFPWSTNFYQNSIFYSTPNTKKTILFENLVYDKFDKKIFDEFIINNSIKYLIITKSEKYFVYKQQNIKLNYDYLENINNELFNVTEKINYLSDTLNDNLVYSDDVFDIFEFKTFPRIYATDINNNRLSIKFNYFWNGFYLANINDDIFIKDIHLNDNFYESYFLITFNQFFSNIYNFLTKTYSESIRSVKFNDTNLFITNKQFDSGHKILIFNKYVMYHLINYIISFIVISIILLHIFKLRR